MTVGYAYLHGFASSPRSKKAAHLRARFAADGLELAVPDLNCPSFAALTLTAELAAVDALVRGRPDVTRWRFIGSSMGGWLAARFAELHPDTVDRLVLLCPGFDMVTRWPALLGANAMARWERERALTFPDADGRPTPLHWGFIEDARLHPTTPDVPCPTVIVHGVRDATVPIATSRAYVALHPLAHLVEVDDDHLLVASTERVAELCRAHFAS